MAAPPFLWYDSQVTNQRFTMPDTVLTRFTFDRDRAKEFSEDGREVVEMVLESIDEVMEYADQFQDALKDVHVLINGQVVALSEFPKN